MVNCFWTHTVKMKDDCACFEKSEMQQMCSYDLLN